MAKLDEMKAQAKLPAKILAKGRPMGSRNRSTSVAKKLYGLQTQQAEECKEDQDNDNTDARILFGPPIIPNMSPATKAGKKAASPRASPKNKK